MKAISVGQDMSLALPAIDGHHALPSAICGKENDRSADLEGDGALRLETNGSR